MSMGGMGGMVPGGAVGVQLQLVTSLFDRALGAVQRRLDQFTRAPVRVTMQLANPMNAVRAAMRAVQAAPGAAVGALRDVIPGAVAAAADMEQKIFRIGRVTGYAGGRLAGLVGELKDMAATMPGVDVEHIFRIAEMGAKLGVAAGGIRLFTRDIAKLSVVIPETDIPVETLTQGIARMLTVFNMGPESALRFASALNRLDLMSAATGADILDVAVRMAGYAATFKMQAHETMALAAALRQVGVPHETAATATGQILMRMASKKSQGGFARLAGMDRRAFEGLMRQSPFEALKAVAKGVSGMDAIKASRALEGLSLDGQRVRAVLLGISRALPVLDQYTAAAAHEFATMDSILKSFNEAAGLTGNQLKTMWSNIQLVAAALGKAMLPVVKAAGAVVAKLATDTRRWLEANQEAFQAWGDWLAQEVSKVSLVFSHFWDVLEYGQLKLEQFAARVGEVLSRAWAGAKVAFGQLGDFLDDLFGKVGAALAVNVRNALKDAIAPFRGWVQQVFGNDAIKAMGLDFRELPGPIRPDFGMFDAGAIGAAVGPAGLMGNLPQGPQARLAEINGRLVDALNKLREEIAAGRRRQEMKDMIERMKPIMEAWAKQVREALARAGAMRPPFRARARMGAEDRDRRARVARGRAQADADRRARVAEQRRRQAMRDAAEQLRKHPGQKAFQPVIPIGPVPPAVRRGAAGALGAAGAAAGAAAAVGERAGLVGPFGAAVRAAIAEKLRQFGERAGVMPLPGRKVPPKPPEPALPPKAEQLRAALEKEAKRLEDLAKNLRTKADLLPAVPAMRDRKGEFERRAEAAEAEAKQKREEADRVAAGNQAMMQKMDMLVAGLDANTREMLKLRGFGVPLFFPGGKLGI